MIGPRQDDKVRFDLGGVGTGGERKTVNLAGDADVRCDIMDVERYAPLDGSVDEFYLSHTLEHIPAEHYVEFLVDLRRKLKTGGRIRVVQTDAGAVIDQWKSGELSFRAMRTTLFPPADRLRQNPYNRHQQMWTEKELVLDFEALGFECETFDAGAWSFDTTDELIPETVESCHGVSIRNIGLTATKPSIPKVIHQTWKDTDIPSDIFRPDWVRSWKDEMPDFEYRLWTDEDNRKLVAERYPWFLETYDAYDEHIKRVDAARYFILHRHGGIYVDLDFVRLRPLDPLLERNDLLLARQTKGCVANAFMGATPGHPVMSEAISRLEGTASKGVIEATGPTFLDQIVGESVHGSEVLPSELIYPYVWHDERKGEYAAMSIEELRQQFPWAFAVTHWTCSWG